MHSANPETQWAQTIIFIVQRVETEYEKEAFTLFNDVMFALSY